MKLDARHTLAISVILVGAGGARGVAQGPALYTGEVYQIDATHSELEFGVRLFGLGRVKGAFRDYNGTLLYDAADPMRSAITVVFRTATIDTDNKARDDHLRSPDFLNVERYPLATFESHRVVRSGDRYVVHGDFTLRGKTRPLSLDMTPTGTAEPDQAGNARIGFTGRVVLRRQDFGIEGGSRFNPNFALTAAVSDDVVIDMDLLFVRWNYAGWSFRGERPAMAAMMERTIDSAGVAAALQQFEVVRRSLRDSLDFTPHNFLILGHKLLRSGRPREAQRVLEIAAAEDPRSTRARWGLALANAALGSRSGALSALDQAMAIDSTDSAVLVLSRRLR